MNLALSLLAFQGIQARPLNEDDMFTWEGIIKGLKDTMWEGEVSWKHCFAQNFI